MKKKDAYSINAFQFGFSQNSTLSGIVSDETGAPFRVNVYQKSTKGLHTDLDGKYLFSDFKTT
jgi:hypothetical protein